MADESGYTRQTTTRAGAPMPQVSAESYGAGLFEQVQRAAGQAERQEIRAYQNRRAMDADQQSSDFARKFAERRQAMDDVIQQARTNPSSPDYQEHVSQVMEQFDASREDMLSGITEDSVRRQAEQQLNSYATSLHGSEVQFAAGQRVVKTLKDNADLINLGSNRIRTAGDPATYAQETKAAYEHIAGLEGITPAQKEDLTRQVDQQYSIAYVNRLNDTNPAMALAQLDAGTYDQVLTPQQIDQLRNGAQVEIRRIDAQAQQVANVEKAAFREQVATVKVKASQGIDVSAELPGLAAKAAVYGDTSLLEELKGIDRENGFAKTWGSLPPLARDQRMAQLRSVPAEKRTDEQQAELKWLDDKKGSLDSQFQNDPLGFAASTAPAGQQPPPINDWTPQEVSARERWVRQAVGAYGSMEPLSATEARALQNQAELGDGGYRAVLQTVSQFSPRMAMQAMRQVLPQDRFAQSLVALAPDTQKRALDGRVAQKANTAILHPPKNDEDAKAQIGGVRAGFLTAMNGLPGDQRYGILDVAESIAADSLARRGRLSEQMSGAMMAWALDRALGAQGEGAEKKGGLGWWQGKIYLLPDRVTARGFESHVYSYIRDHPNDGPVNPDGTRADLRNARPQAMSGGRYQFLIGDRYVLGRDGKPWIRTVRAR